MEILLIPGCEFNIWGLQVRLRHIQTGYIHEPTDFAVFRDVFRDRGSGNDGGSRRMFQFQAREFADDVAE
jgi:hypothetical protein